MKKIGIILLSFVVSFTISANAFAAKAVQIKSPSGQIIVELNTQKGQLGWTVTQNGQKLFTMENVGMVLANKPVGTTAGSVKQRAVSETIKPVVPLKNSNIQSSYTEARVSVENGTLVLRVMDNAVAYRFETKVKG